MLAGNLGIDGSFHSLHFASPALLDRASSSYFCAVASAKLSEHTFTQGTVVQTDSPGHPAPTAHSPEREQLSQDVLPVSCTLTLTACFFSGIS